MFNANKFIATVSDESIKVRVNGVRKMFQTTPSAFLEFVHALLDMQPYMTSRSPRDVFLFKLKEAVSISERRLPTDFQVSDMNRGKSMFYHPVTGDEIKTLRIRFRKTPCIRRPTYGEWNQWTGDIVTGGEVIYDAHLLKGKEKLPRIGDGAKHKEGEPYPAHWIFDPWTGERL